MAERPNVLFILSDQHNAKCLGYTGLTDAITPTFDRMAERGVRFDRAVPQNGICTPSRVSWLSGQYCHNHGYYGLSGPNPGGLPTVLGYFRRHGYHTGAVGKIHCPEYWLEDDCDEFHETDRTSVGGSCREYLDHQKRRGINIYDEYGMGVRPSPFDYEDTQEGWSARKVIDIIQNAAQGDKPFFVHFSLTKPHGPYTPAKRFWDLYDQDKLRLPPNADYDMEKAGKSPLIRSMAANARKSETFDQDRYRKLNGYLGNITQCDYAVGEVLEFLEARGMLDNTIVIYSADHGEYACEHGPTEKVPGVAADAVMRIPMIWQWPGHFKVGHVEAEQVVEAVDMVPTLCELTGLPRLETVDGRSIAPLLRGESRAIHTIGVTEFPFSRSVRKGKWRLVYYPPGFFGDEAPNGFGELYDLDADPWEMRNLYYDPARAGVVREIERDLLDWLVTTLRPKTMHGPAGTDNPQYVKRFRAHPVGEDGKIHTDLVWDGLPSGPYR